MEHAREPVYRALISISSTTIIAKAFEEEHVDQKLRDLALGVLLTEDLTAVIELAVLTALASGAAVSVSMIVGTVAKLALFLAVLVGAGMLLVPPAIQMIVRLDRAETILVASVGICFAFALFADRAGYSVAMGAFLAGMLIAESGQVHRIEHLVAPLRDLFASVFFVSVGMMLDPTQIEPHWQALVLLTLVVLGAKTVSVSIAAMLAGTGVKTSVATGMSLAQIGEFSFIIAGVGLQLGAANSYLYTIAIAISVVTTFTTPFMIRASGSAGEWVARRLPESIGAMSAMYSGWMEQVRSVPEEVPERRSIRWSIVEIGSCAAAIAAI